MPTFPDDPLGIKALDFGDYHIIEYVARGSFGYVYRAESKKGKTAFAFKFLDPDQLNDQTVFAYFCQEGAREEIASLKGFPGIVRYDHLKEIPYPDSSNKERNLPYWIMEYVRGETLDQFLWPDNQRKPCSPSRSVRIAYLIAKTLCLAHDKNIAHCDIKPNNIMVQIDPNSGLPDHELIRITDWATALRVGDKARKAAQSFHQGNPRYAPPESAYEFPDEKYDVYSLATVLFEMLTGRMPHPKTIAREDLKKKLFANTGIDSRLQDCLALCFHEQADARPTMRKLASDLLKWLQDDSRHLSSWLDTEAASFGQLSSWSAKDRKSPNERTRIRLSTALIMMLLGFAGGAGLLFKYYRDTERPAEISRRAQDLGAQDLVAINMDLSVHEKDASSDLAAVHDQALPQDMLPPRTRLCWKIQEVTAGGIGSSELTLYDVWGSGNRYLYVSGQYDKQGVILSSSNAGSSWRLNIVQRSSLVYSGWASSDGSEIYAVGANATILKSTNAGLTWDAKPTGVPPIEFRGIWGTPAGDAIYVVGGAGTILISVDHGESWYKAYENPPSQSMLKGIWGRNRNDVWVVSQTGEILHGQMGSDGLHWQTIPDAPASGIRLFDIWGSGSELFAVGVSSVSGNGALLLSADGGQSWHRREVREGLWAISGDGPGIYVAGDGLLEAPLRQRLTDWQPEQTELIHAPRRLRGIWGRGERLYAVGDRGVLFVHQTCGGK